MLEDIITGEDNPEHLASLALGRLRMKIPITTCSRRKDPSPSSLSASAFTGLNTVCGTRNCIARRTPGGHRPTKAGAVASGGSLEHDTGGRSSGPSRRGRGQHGAVSNRRAVGQLGRVVPRQSRKCRQNVCAVQLLKGVHGCAAWLVNAPGLPREPRTLTCPRRSDA
jgi:hypothetical protein